MREKVYQLTFSAYSLREGNLLAMILIFISNIVSFLSLRQNCREFEEETERHIQMSNSITLCFLSLQKELSQGQSRELNSKCMDCSSHTASVLMYVYMLTRLGIYLLKLKTCNCNQFCVLLCDLWGRGTSVKDQQEELLNTLSRKSLKIEFSLFCHIFALLSR